MTALDYLCQLPYVPTLDGKVPSNGERRRWLESKSVIINGVKPGSKDEVNYPITELVFFPKGRRCTML